MTTRRSALVTGAAGGLGCAIAGELAAAGFDLVLVGRSAETLDALAVELHAGYPSLELRPEVCDLASEPGIHSLIDALAAERRLPDVLVNNAAAQGPIGRFIHADWPEWTATLAVDLMAPALLTRLALPAMIEGGWGRVINVSGGGATGPRPDFSAYAVAKTGLVRLTETLAHELSGTGVTVNAIAPGPMNTRMLQEVLEAGPSGASEEYPAAVARAREGGVPPAKAAALVAWLASDEAAGITGRLLSAVWDPWDRLGPHLDDLAGSDIYTLRRIVPKDRGRTWEDA